MATAEEFKAKGNAALTAGNATEAIANYTSAINLDGSNHVFYSNRSAAYLKKGDASNALEDADACIGLKTDFAKGYSRKGAALHALKRYNDSIAAYKVGIDHFPADKGLLKGLGDVEKEKDKPAYGGASMGGMGGMGGMRGMGGANPMAGMFGPQARAKMALDPKLRPLLQDSDFMAKLDKLESDPNSLTTMLGDPNMMTYLSAMLGGGGGDDDMDESSDYAPAAPKAPTPAAPKAPAPEPEEDLSQLSDADRKKKEDRKESIAAKLKGNELYKSKKFDEAIASYDEAIALDDTNMTFHSNKAAVYFTTKKYDECIEACNKAVEVGNDNRAPFEERAKALTRAAKAYQKKGDMAMAISYCNKAQLENFDKATQRLLKTLELEKRKADTLAYHDDEKAQAAKSRGNDHFRAKEWGDAVREYEDAVKRAPKDAAIRNNLSAALCKVMDFNGAKRQVDEALEIDPKYVKAWARKGDIEIMMKEYHKALESYQKGLNFDGTNAACREGLRKTAMLINQSTANMTDAEKKERAAHAMADPEIQAILSDPVIQQVLKDFSENPQAANDAFRDPSIKAKIEKLIAAGVVQTG